MDEPYFNVIYSWKLSAETLTNLIDLFNNIIFQARQTSLYEHWLDQVSAAKRQQHSKADGKGKKAFSGLIVSFGKKRASANDQFGPYFWVPRWC